MNEPEMGATGHGQIFRAEKDMTITQAQTQQDIQKFNQRIKNKLLIKTGSGRTLSWIGVALFIFSGAGILSTIISDITGTSGSSTVGQKFPWQILGTVMPSGARVGMVYILGGIIGLVLSKIGSAIVSAAARRASISGHMVAATITVIVAVVGFGQLSAGAPSSTLVPNFSELFHTGTGTVPTVAPLTSNGGGASKVVKPEQLPPVVPQQNGVIIPQNGMCSPAAITLSPSSGPVGTTLTVTGQCFEPGEIVVIRFHTDIIAEPKSDGKGGFIANGTVPNSYQPFAGNQFEVSATGKVSIRSDSQPFELTAS